MIDIETWGGAQWLLAFWLFLRVSLLALLGWCLDTKNLAAHKSGVLLAKWISAITLFYVLAWGGFWS